MGKNLKGRECGKGLSQRKDGKYSARFVTQDGKRCERYFATLPEARNWLADAQYKDTHAMFKADPNITVDEWYKYWYNNIIFGLAPNTKRNYRERYNINVKPVLGKMKMVDVKPLHCRMVLNNMDADYAGSTILQAYIMMGTMFKAAINNDVIFKHPMNGVKCTKPIRQPGDVKFLTVEEQREFLQAAQRSHNYYQYALMLETGLRTGELIGLTWDEIDWDKREILVSKTLEYRHNAGIWRAGPPKTRSSYRTIPLTSRAYEILRTVEAQKSTRKMSPDLITDLPYIDRLSGKTYTLDMRDLVFINYRTGWPNKNSSYDTHLYKLCDEAGIKRFCMHALRHTFATRAIESGMRPKDLQKILGHASIKTTMDKYVHVTKDAMLTSISSFEQYTREKIGQNGVKMA